MPVNVLSRLFGSRNDRLVRRMRARTDDINVLEAGLLTVSDEALRERTAALKARVQGGAALDTVLPEAFAVVREGARRVLGMRHFDVQLIGGMALHAGKIAEMRTGEGKTLVATLAAYLNALTGRGVHVVTVNDYLARRDAEWMGRVYRFLGLTVGVIVSDLDSAARREAYGCDITYGTNNEFGFDYLRDNMVFQLGDKVQRGLHYAIVDEVDSILIDEARTPLIISGATDDNPELYRQIDLIVPRLTQQDTEDGPGDYSVDEKAKQVALTEAGHERVEQLLIEAGLLAPGGNLYDVAEIGLLYHLNAALRAHAIYHRDVDYIIKNNEVIIIDEFTGRMMTGRRWSDGLHQAIEAKERVAVQNENQTLASITFQNYFRLYEKLSGMTGTADTEAFEFQEIYGLEVMVIPTHRSICRTDLGDQIYRTAREKHQAISHAIGECHGRGQPVLVGTTSIENSEHLALLLRDAKIPHQVLNAKHHEREAHIIAEAGRPGAVTIATNMAGRGTDIVLGGNPDAELAAVADEGARAVIHTEWQARHDAVVAAGGLHVIGTERHESRRIDNQLRGRSGRQGDPGSTRFYLSLEDSLMRIFGSDRVSGLMQKLGMQEGEAIEHPWVSRAIENAQRKVEGHHFDIRKQLLEYDDVANAQRKVIYEQRNHLLERAEVSGSIEAITQDVLNAEIDNHVPRDSFEEQWDIAGLTQALSAEFGLTLALQAWLEAHPDLHEQGLREWIVGEARQRYVAKVAVVGHESMQQFEKAVMLQVLDTQWKDHLAAMDHLRQGIGLRGYAQKNPKEEYKREAFELFSAMLDRIKHEVVATLLRVEVDTPAEIEAMEMQRAAPALHFEHPAFAEGADPGAPADEIPTAVAAGGGVATVLRQQPKVGRNEPCPCGSGKKYKQCHGRLA